MKLRAQQLGVSVGKHTNQFQLYYANTVYLRRLKKQINSVSLTERRQRGAGRENGREGETEGERIEKMYI